MNIRPTIGGRYVFIGGAGYPMMTGTVVRIYPAWNHDTSTMKPFDPQTWRVAFAVDEEDVPDPWPYQTNRFAPPIALIEPLAEGGTA